LAFRNVWPYSDNFYVQNSIAVHIRVYIYNFGISRQLKYCSKHFWT